MVFLARFPFKKLGWHLAFFFLRLIEIAAKLLPSFLKREQRLTTISVTELEELSSSEIEL
jgi:hypothetical protein